MDKEAPDEPDAMQEALRARNEALSYHTYAKEAIAEARLRSIEGLQVLLEHSIRKTSDRSVRVLFLTAHTSLFDVYLPIYRAMEADPAFEPRVLAFKRTDIDSDLSEEEVRSFFDNLDIPAQIEGYGEEAIYPPLDASEQDVLFYTLGSVAYPPAYRMENTAPRFLTAYLSYGFLLARLENYQFNQDFHHYAWRLYASTERERGLYTEHSKRYAGNILTVGYPKFDLYRTQFSKPLAGNKDRPLVVWSPHWTIGLVYPALNFGCFSDLCAGMSDVFDRFRDQVDFLFKPHPNLKYALKTTGFMSAESYQFYMDSLASKPNVQVWTQGNNIDLFQRSSAMITDSISFLAEYLPSGKPMAFSERPDRVKLSYVGEKLIDLYTRVRTADDISDFVENIVLQGYDPDKENRMRHVQSLLNVQETSTSQQILDDLKARLRP